jgi:hypothetical protein
LIRSKILVGALVAGAAARATPRKPRSAWVARAPRSSSALYEVTATGQVLVAEEFQINTHVPGQRWGVEFTDDDRVVFVDIKTSTGGPVDVVAFLYISRNIQRFGA